MNVRPFSTLLWLLPSFATTALALDDRPVAFDVVARDFEGTVAPLMKRYCLECHSTEEQEGDLDLERFAGLDHVRNAPRVWQRVAEMLDGREMPPKEARQPTADERTRLGRWVRDYLAAEAKARAGDPGRVVLRRLSNAEYTYTLRDLTGLDSLDPAREFPADGAAGEGFTNTGNSLVMSPSMVAKYLDAAKEVAAHAVLLPDGFRFSPQTTPRDWTEEVVTRIREFYRGFADRRGGDEVNLQGITFETNQGGRLPVERYLAATLAERGPLSTDRKSIEAVALERGLNAKYLRTLWASLTGPESSLLLDGLRARWRAAKPEDAASLAADVAAWQKGLWKFATVGHIGKVGGPRKWLEPVTPLVAAQDVRFKIPAPPDGKDVAISLKASDAGDGNEHDLVVWQRPRLVAPGRPDLLLRDVRELARDLAARRERIFADASKYLAAADEAQQGKADLDGLAARHGVEPDALRAWLDTLGIGSGDAVELAGHFTNKLHSGSGHDFIKGWGGPDTPVLVANSSDQHVRIPGNMKPHSVAVHPSPTLRTAVGWRSPVAATIRVGASVTHAHPECGNGVTWSLELRRGATRQRLAAGTSQGAREVKVGPIDRLAVKAGDLVSLLIGPRGGNHACDLTSIDLRIAQVDEVKPAWDLAADVSSDVLAGNPHADRLGNAGVWHFYTEPDRADGEAAPVIPAGSLLARWQSAGGADERQRLAGEVQALLTAGPPAAKDSPDAALYRQLSSLGGPLFGRMLAGRAGEAGKASRSEAPTGNPATARAAWGPDPALFGKHPGGLALDPVSLCVRAPSVITFRLPAELAAGCELVTTGSLDQDSGREGSVQLEVVAGESAPQSGLHPSKVTETLADGQWTSDNRRIAYGTPIVVNEGSAARKRLEAAFDDFRRLFPAALCYTKIVPVDEVVTLTLFYREDEHLARLMLDESEKERLDRLWDELHYISRDALTLVDAFAQLMEYATQDADPKVFEPLRKPINDRAAAFRKWLVDTEPKHLDALLEFASKAHRRPLADAEGRQLRQLYEGLRSEGISHDESFRLMLARVLVAPAFLYRIEKPGPGSGQGPVSNQELASRLSYFLWSSQPDEELRQVAAAGRLGDPSVLLAQSRRMVRDPRARRLAVEFACRWLHIVDFDRLDEKSERHFPTFAGLRGAMYEESIRFFADLFRDNGRVLDILDADHTFLDEPLAKHYGIPWEPSGPTGWRRVDGIKRYGRGGILGQSTTLATQSGASRTSPILRGNWISEVLLGERLPRPPKGVPQLPDDEAATEGQTVRQLVEKHSSDAKCAVCHQRIDPFGFSLEGFDAIGRRRDKDLGDRPIDTRVKAMDGAQFDGLDGLRSYLLTTRRDAFLRQFCRKLLGFALGRSVQLSDELLLSEMQSELKANGYRVGSAIEAIVRSRQFREVRGRESTYTD